MQSSSCSGKWSLPVMLIVDLSLTRVVQHSPTFPQIDGAVRAYAHAHDDHYLTRSKFNSLLTEMITPQTEICPTNIQIYIYTYKTASCTSCIRGSLRLAPNNNIIFLCDGLYTKYKISYMFCSLIFSHFLHLSWVNFNLDF